MEALSIPSLPVCKHRFPRVGYWQLPSASVCSPVIANKNSIPAYAALAFFLEHSVEHSDSVHVYTDGSKSEAGVGYGAVFPSFCRGGGLPGVASVFTAELSAIVIALKYIFTLPISSFTIFSDSHSALSALESFNFSCRHPLISSIFEWLFLLYRRGYHVCFCWVPAHVGVPGNERADRLAREAAERAAPPVPVYFRDMFSPIRLAARRSWQRRWEALAANTKMGEVTRTVARPWTYEHVRDRHSQTSLARLRIGHTRLTHSYLMSGDEQPYCDDCLVPLTVRHLLVECPSLGDLRDRFLHKCRRPDGVFLLSKILGHECLSAGCELLDFVRGAGLLQQL